ncbi:Oxygen sensor histidine kinase NreB [Aquisphaera giovannonii]|uniref:Oxygen sensor histidine kinase NreB n=1 Tax=Aquisphaera giovannonii TaxID=406548 RepID=A0A5B9W6D2_9BACT|nr:PAS domain-containing protein [Aquisphaera giovannonii]QEH35521.1 Oxygen sensor histidine kinase NreB [Aquisphaera giovannonii]
MEPPDTEANEASHPPAGDGEMAARVRAFDWSATPLGPPAGWPRSLRTIVDLLLAHPMPSIVLWGPDLIQIYNDGYARIAAGKHPAALGQPTRECWPEAWHINGPIYERVLARGESVLLEDRLIPLARQGVLEDAYFTLTYSPARDDDGRIGGVFLTVIETTAKVRAERERDRQDAHRRRAEERLRDSESRYRAFVRASSDLVYRMSPDWTELREQDGGGFLARAESPSRSWLDDYILPEDRPHILAAIRDSIEGKRPFDLEHRVIRADGTVGWTHSRAVPILDDRGEIVEWFGAARDVTDRRRAEEVLRASEERDAFLLRLSDAMRPLADPAEVLTTASRLLGEHLGVNRALYAEIEGEGDARECLVRGQYASRVSPFPGRASYSAFSDRGIGERLRRGEPLVVSDASTDPTIGAPQRAAWLAAEIRSTVTVPLVKQGRDVAVFAVHGARPREWTAAEVELVREVAERTWAAAERAEAQAALRESRRQLARELEDAKTLQRVSSLLIEDEAGGDLHEQILDAAMAILRADFGSIQLFDAGSGELHLLGWRGFHPDSAEFWRTVSIRSGTSCALALRHGERAIVPDAHAAGSPLGAESLRHFALSGIVAMQSTPLTTRDGQLVGMISTHWREVHTPGPRELRLLDVLAREAADFFERRRVREALRRGESRLRMALAASRMGMWTWDVARDAHRRDANLNALLGLDRVETVRPLGDFLARMDPGDRGPAREAFEEAARRGRPLGVEFRVVRPDGGVRWLRDQGDASGEGADGDLRLAGVCVDVTDLKEAQAALRRANEELEDQVARRTAALAEAMAQRAELTRRLAAAQEEERLRISRELHDSIGQLVAGLMLSLKAVETAEALPPSLGGKLADARSLVDEVGREVHALAMRLRPTSLDDIGLDAALGQLVSDWSARSGVPAAYQAAGLDAGRLPSEIETTVYRIVQEALTNATKHAGAGRVSVVVTRTAGHVTAVVEDDGAGFDPDATQGGRLGLAGMRERADLVGGELLVESGPGSGTVIVVRIPAPGDDGR